MYNIVYNYRKWVMRERQNICRELNIVIRRGERRNYMVEYILGDYLVETGKISKEQLDDVVGQLDKVRVKLGLIAVAEGMMTTEQADEVNKLQAVMDKRFGDIAVEKGYLTDEQIGNLLKAQGNTYMTFVQALINEGLVKMEEIEDILEGFRVKNSFSKMDIEILKSDDPDVVVPLFLTPETLKYQEIIGVVVRTIIRCIDRHVYIGKATLSDKCPLSFATVQKVDGEKGFVSAFMEQDGGLLKLASVFGQEDFIDLDDDALDAACEFLNCVNGLHASTLSQRGAILELLPPEMIEYTGEINGQVCSIPIYVSNKKLLFIVTE